MKQRLLTVLCAIAITGCKRDDNIDGSETRTMYYRQTNCMDPWGNGGTDAGTLVKLRTYLDQQHLYHSNELLKQEAYGELCNSCSCRTGKVFHVNVLPVQEQAYGAIGFYE